MLVNYTKNLEARGNMTENLPFLNPDEVLSFDGHPMYRGFEVIKMANGKVFLCPCYQEKIIPDGYCAAYAKRVTNDFFERKYGKGDAWDLRYDYVTMPVEDLTVQHMRGAVKEGDLVGFTYSETTRLNQLDKRGRPALYTHVAIFLGRDSNGEMRFGQQIYQLSGTLTLREMHPRFQPKEIIKDIPLSFTRQA